MARLLNRETRRDFHPRAQVVIEVERPRVTVGTDGTITRAGGRLIALDFESLIDASVNMSLTRPADASFTVANPRDKWFNSARKLRLLTSRQKEVSDYLLEVLRISSLSEHKDFRSELF
jgi:hypothetical protein